MKTLYILLTRPTTLVSRVIHTATRDQFTHISISFESNLEPLYSFSRKYARSPLPAGMTTEAIAQGFYKDRGFITCALYELPVSSSVYYAAKKEAESMYNKSEAYRFNILGLALCKLNIPMERSNHYFCSQFVSSLLENSGALRIPKNSGLMRPADFLEIPELKLVFQGDLASLQDYLNYEVLWPGYKVSYLNETL